MLLSINYFLRKYVVNLSQLILSNISHYWYWNICYSTICFLFTLYYHVNTNSLNSLNTLHHWIFHKILHLQNNNYLFYFHLYNSKILVLIYSNISCFHLSPHLILRLFHTLFYFYSSLRHKINISKFEKYFALLSITLNPLSPIELSQFKNVLRFKFIFLTVLLYFKYFSITSNDSNFSLFKYFTFI